MGSSVPSCLKHLMDTRLLNMYCAVADSASLVAAGESLKRLGKWGQTRLRIGAAASACRHIFPRVIRELKKSYAQWQLQIESGETPEMVELVRANKVDLVNLRPLVADAAAGGRMILVPFDFDDAAATDFYRQSATDAAIRTNRFDRFLDWVMGQPI